MSPEKIKHLLHAWRPGADAPKEVERAREQAAGDPELAAWLEQERAFDAAFANKLREITPPPGLMDEILAAAANDKVAVLETRVSAVSARQKWWMPAAAGLAASVAIMAGIFSLIGGGSPVNQPPGPQTAGHMDVAGFVNLAVAEALNVPVEEQRSFALVKARLESAHAPVPDVMPQQLVRLQPNGCKPLVVHGTTVSVIRMESEEGQHHLLIVDREPFGHRCSRFSKPVIYDMGDRFAATWLTGDKLFILVTSRKGEAIVRTIHDI